jgi:hypothetical protein
MTSHAEAAENREPQGRWNGPSSTWFLFMVGSWIGFGVAAVWYPEALTDFWEWGRGLPLVAEIALWIATLPWMLALAVFETAWADWVQVSLIVALALSWIVFSRPRTPKSSSPNARRDAQDTTLRPEAR